MTAFRRTLALVLMLMAPLGSVVAEEAVPQVVKLPAAASDAVVGASGRYLLLLLGRINKVAVLDVEGMKIVKYLDVQPGDVHMAANCETLIIAGGDRNVIQRWSLSTLSRELTVVIPDGGEVRSAGMGFASAGPLLLVTSHSMRFFDPRSLRRTDHHLEAIHELTGHFLNTRGPVQIRASADGSLFTTWIAGTDSFNALALLGPDIHWGRSASRPGEMSSNGVATPGFFLTYALPATDASCVFTDGGTLTPAMSIAAKPEKRTLLPAAANGFAMEVEDIVSHKVVSLRVPGAGSTPLGFGQFPELGTGPAPASALPLEKRLFCFPNQGRFIAVSNSGDELHARSFDLIKSLDEAKIDYFFVASFPLPIASRGAEYKYSLDVKSALKDIRCSLASAPKGMTLNNRTLQWLVPGDFKDEQASVVVNVTRPGGAILQAFTIAVR
jgi:hypothetical protein